MTGSEIVKPKEAPLATIDALPSFASIVEAVGKGTLSADGVATLLDAFLKVKAANAEQEYNLAFAAFQENCPTIPRSKTAEIVSQKGSRFSYDYADVETIMETISSTLTSNGLSVSFEDVTVEGNMLTATCRCSHIGGHSRVSSFSVCTDTSAGMSTQQKYGAAATYAQRRALSQRLGLWTGDPDRDGGEPSPKLTTEQQDRIVKLADETGTDWSKLLKWWGVANFDEACQDKYRAAVRFLEQKKRQTGGAP